MVTKVCSFVFFNKMTKKTSQAVCVIALLLLLFLVVVLCVCVCACLCACVCMNMLVFVVVVVCLYIVLRSFPQKQQEGRKQIIMYLTSSVCIVLNTVVNSIFNSHTHMPIECLKALYKVSGGVIFILFY